jgi:hypothetical protein
MDLSTPEVRRWSSQTLRYIAQTMGIQQAAVLAKVIDSQVDIEVWHR